MSDQKVAVVTGAGSGIGRAAALLLAQAGYHVVLTGRTKSKLEAVARSISEHKGASESLVVVADLTNEDDCQRIIEATCERFGRVDAVANVAGDAPLLPIDQITPTVWRRCIDTNLSSIVQLTAVVWPVFRKQKCGVIVNISSMASIDPFPGFAAYAAAKCGVNMFTLVTGREGAEIGVRAVAIAPGAVETPMLRSLFDEKMLPREQTLSPESVAEVIRDCITGDRTFEPGETIPMPNG